MKPDETIIGIDLGGTKIEGAIVDSNGLISQSIKMKTLTADGPDAIVGQIVDIVHELDAKNDGNSPAGIGIGLAGQIDSEHGIVRSAPNLGWDNYPILDKLAEKMDIPCNIDNDVRMAAYGEWIYGAGRGTDNLICIFVGTGVGGGIVSDGQLLHGYNNTAGEIGHITINLEGSLCSCGNFGCLEAYAGGRTIERTAKQLVKKNSESGAGIIKHVDGNIDKITAATVVKAAREGDEPAQHIMRQAVEALIAGCSSLINALSPKLLILGGGVIDGYEEIIEQVADGIGRRTLGAAMSGLEIVKAELGANAGVIGAAATARRLINRKENGK
jgi:glucokinase